MTAKVILPLMDGRWLAMTPGDFQAALEQGKRLMPVDKPADTPEPRRVDPLWVTLTEAARLTSMSKSFWSGQAQKRLVPTRKFGESVRISYDFLVGQNYQSGVHSDVTN